MQSIRDRKNAELMQQKVTLVMWRQIYEILPECRKKEKGMKLHNEMNSK